MISVFDIGDGGSERWLSKRIRHDRHGLLRHERLSNIKEIRSEANFAPGRRLNTHSNSRNREQVLDWT